MPLLSVPSSDMLACLVQGGRVDQIAITIALVQESWVHIMLMRLSSRFLQHHA
jgi:hypothetical protein